MYGMRDAGLNWAKEAETAMKSLGFQKSGVCICSYRHVSKEIDVVVHRDDFMVVASKKSLKWIYSEPASRTRK